MRLICWLGLLAAAFVTPAATQSGTDKVSENALIDEMKAGRNRLFAIIAVALAVVAVLVFLIAR